MTEPGFIGRIPVRNIWLLMLYASGLSRFANTQSAGLEADTADLPDLIARLLTAAVALRIKRNLTRGYQPRQGALRRVRGRIDLLRTESQRLLESGQVYCRYAEFTIDTPRNRLVRAALERMSRVVASAELRQQCRVLALTLANAGIAALRPTRVELARDQLGRNDDADRTVVALANLAFDLALPAEEAGPVALPIPAREDHWVRRLFENAVLGFASHELIPKGWRVRGSVPLQWDVSNESAGMHDILPGMTLDIVLHPPGAQVPVIVDTKFTDILCTGRFGQIGLKSGYLYQMYAYLRSQPAWAAASGLFIHPAIGTRINEHAVIQGHRITYATVDLTASAAAIRTELLNALASAVPPADQ